ncbi:MAG: NTP transferase domain-containing protein [Candidatus Nitrosopelagicus sp.]|nr:NTP transferase domain-containing protein [Candidatus Nitrosopelagicus sp.]
MKVVILAAGVGKRLGNLTENIPKPMIRVFDKPILEYIVNDLVNSGFNDICIIIGHYGEQIKQYFGSGEKFNVKITYVTQIEYNGTADATWYAKDFVNDEKFLLHLGDAINPNALRKYTKNMLDDEADVSIISVEIEDSMKKKVGNIEIDGNSVVKISEKSEINKSNLAWQELHFLKTVKFLRKSKKWMFH